MSCIGVLSRIPRSSLIEGIPMGLEFRRRSSMIWMWGMRGVQQQAQSDRKSILNTVFGITIFMTSTRPIWCLRWTSRNRLHLRFRLGV